MLPTNVYIYISTNFVDRLAVDNEDEDYAFHIKTHPALKEFPPHYRNGFKLLVSSEKFLCALRFLW